MFGCGTGRSHAHVCAQVESCIARINENSFRQKVDKTHFKGICFTLYCLLLVQPMHLCSYFRQGPIFFHSLFIIAFSLSAFTLTSKYHEFDGYQQDIGQQEVRGHTEGQWAHAFLLKNPAVNNVFLRVRGYVTKVAKAIVNALAWARDAVWSFQSCFPPKNQFLINPSKKVTKLIWGFFYCEACRSLWWRTILHWSASMCPLLLFYVLGLLMAID